MMLARLRLPLAVLLVSGTVAAFADREEAYRANNVGVALLEQFRFEEAAARFRRALEIDPDLAMARLNLAVALLNVPDLEGARREATLAAERLPQAPQPPYVLALVAKSQSRTEEAIAAFRRVLALDPADVGSLVNLGQIHVQQKRYGEAIAAFRAALAAEPYNATAAYNLGIALTRSGQREEGQKMLELFQKMREGGYATTIGLNYPDQGRYAEAVASTGAEPELVDARTPAVTFVDVTATAILGAPAPRPAPLPAFGRRLRIADLTEATKRELAAGLSGRVTLLDYDGDGALDVFEVGPFGQRLLRNDHGRLVDVTKEAGLDPGAAGIGAVAGDYDNDGRADLFILRYGGGTLLHNEDGRFADVTAAAGIRSDPFLSLSAAFVDVDHDGDLDLVVVGFVDLGRPPAGEPGREIVFPDDFPGAPNRLLRNNGNGTFTEVTEAAGLAGHGGHGLAVVPTDFDNHRDVDLLVLNYDRGPNLFRNLRDGRFEDVGAEAGLPPAGRFTAVTAADVNKDGFTDFFFGTAEGSGLLALSDGHERFRVGPGPAAGSSAAEFLDYDEDGLIDLVTVGESGAHVARNVGSGGWADVTGGAVPRDGGGSAFAAADLDGDGRLDLVLRRASGELRLWQNGGASPNRTLRIDLSGRVSNRQGVGAKIELRAGSLRQKLETAAATPPVGPAQVIFGLGQRAAADAVRILWPSGTVQAELGPAAEGRAHVAEAAPSPAHGGMAIQELDRKPSSCPFLYAWNGRRFEFVTDFMGGGEMGYWEGPEWNTPVPEEWVRLRDDQLAARDGRLELRVTNELEEAVFVDRLKLVAVAHPADVEVYPNEGLAGVPRRPFRLYAVRHLRPPRSARDDRGRDVLDRVARRDRRFVDGFALLPVRGYAEEHALVLDLAAPPEAPAASADAGDRTLLLLNGWTDYAFSSDNVAAHQRGWTMRPPSLQVEDAQGRWVTAVADIGFPVGRPQTLVVDLAGLWKGPSRRVRIVTNMRIYWDQVLVGAAAPQTALGTASLEPVVATLGERGFSAETSPDGREPLGYDYARVSRLSPWKQMPGRYTRVGDVRELLAKTDDLFVISRPGDEIALSFDAAALPPLPGGWRRTYLLYADGFSKEMDINSASPDAVGPLPFHGMTRYPYAPPEAYPMTPERRAVIERYNTRVVAAPLAPIELVRAEER